jgi:DNA-binding LacI/PurR family transcriptional regulator
MPRYASSIDLARLAGVSQSSVSRTYRPGASVSAKTRLAGFDDIAMAGWAAYDLTTFVQEARLMVSETIRVLQTAEDAAPPCEAHLVLPARLIERGFHLPGRPR